MIISEPGIYEDVDADAYFADLCPEPSLNQSGIPDLLDKSPYHFAYRQPRLNPYGLASTGERAQWLGAATHRVTLGRGREISTVRYNDYQSSSAREARDLAISNGRIPVLEKELVKVRDMAEILKLAIREALDGADYVTEVVIVWQEETEHGPIWARGMLDIWCPERSMALDLKALGSPATTAAFGKTAANFGYAIQDGFYRRGLGKILPDMEGRIKFADLVVESLPPHGAQTMEPGPITKSVADMQISQAIELFGKCLHNRSWPSYPKQIGTYETPKYYNDAVLLREAWEV